MHAEPQEGTDRSTELLRLMRMPEFPEVAKKLERGYHFTPADGLLWHFLSDNRELARAYFDLFRSELVFEGVNYAYLDADPDIFGVARLGAEDMVVGAALALALFRPERVTSGGIRLDVFVESLRTMLSGNDVYLDIFDQRRSRKASEAHRKEKALQELTRSLRRLAKHGFVTLITDGEDLRIEPRRACLRFMLVVQQTIGDDSLSFDDAVTELLAQGRLHPMASDPGNAVEEDDDDGEQEDQP